MLLLTAPPKLAPSVNAGVHFLLTSLMKVLRKTGLNMPRDSHLPLNRWVLVVCQGHHSVLASSTPRGQGASGLRSVVAVGHSTEEPTGWQSPICERSTEGGSQLPHKHTGDAYTLKRLMKRTYIQD